MWKKTVVTVEQQELRQDAKVQKNGNGNGNLVSSSVPRDEEYARQMIQQYYR